MSAVWLRLRAEFRSHLAATVALIVLVGVSGGVVLAALGIPATRQMANLTAALPGRIASRTQPAVILRTE
jgi:hypothetical protein